MEKYFARHQLERMRFIFGLMACVVLFLPTFMPLGSSFQGVLFPVIGMMIFLPELMFFIKNRSSVPSQDTVRMAGYGLLTSKRSIALLIILLGLYLSQFYFAYLIEISSPGNLQAAKTLDYEITKNATTDLEKAKAIYDWMQSPDNMKNSYGKPILILYPLSITATGNFPFIVPCIKIFEHRNPEWIASSRCGTCLEYSLFYKLLAENANLTVRSVHNPGEDHSFDEVNIAGNWIVVDPSMARFNDSRSFYEEARNLNVSYVFAEYPNGTKEDITRFYSSLCNLSVRTINNNGDNLSGSTVEFLSDNYRSNLPMGLNCTTGNDGICNVSMGCGKYTLFATGGNDGSYHSRESFVLDNSTLSKDIVLNNNFDIFTPLPASMAYLTKFFELISLVVIWMALSFYWNVRSAAKSKPSKLTAR
jgi:hypothetical protein